MNKNFYKIGFFSLLAIVLFILVYNFYSAKTFFDSDTTTTTPTTEDTSEVDSMIIDNNHMIRLIDSVKLVKDSINLVITFMNDSIPLEGLPTDQIENYKRTFNLLTGMKTMMDFSLDQTRLKLLKSDFDELEVVIRKYDKKREKLNKLSSRLSSLTKIIKITIDVLAKAVSGGIIVTPTS